MDNWKENFNEWYINTSGQNYLPSNIIIEWFQKQLDEQPSPPTRLREVIEFDKLVEQARLHAESLMDENWDRRDHIYIGTFYTHLLRKLKSITDLPLPASSLKDELTIEDYKEVIEDNNRLCREPDAIINGDTMAEQASLCDLVSQLRKMFEMK